MMEKMIENQINVSIALASYNGEKFIKEQLLSILNDIKSNDEIVISDDGSNDNTIDIIKKIALQDKRIKITYNQDKGVSKNFENAITKCVNDIIFLSDQDDLWIKGKRDKIVDIFKKNPHCNLVTHSPMFVDEKHNEIVNYNNFKMRHGFLKNIIKSSFYGCCMAFRKSAIVYFLPFPKELNAHDQFIGLIFEKRKENIFLKEKLILHILHDNNISKKMNNLQRIKFRKKLISSYFIANEKQYYKQSDY